MGEMLLERSHSLMASLSYENPSVSTTGSPIISSVMGQMNSLGGFTGSCCGGGGALSALMILGLGVGMHKGQKEHVLKTSSSEQLTAAQLLQ